MNHSLSNRFSFSSMTHSLLISIFFARFFKAASEGKRTAQMAFNVLPCALKLLPQRLQKELTLIIKITLSKMYWCVMFEVLGVMQIRKLFLL